MEGPRAPGRGGAGFFFPFFPLSPPPPPRRCANTTGRCAGACRRYANARGRCAQLPRATQRTSTMRCPSSSAAMIESCTRSNAWRSASLRQFPKRTLTRIARTIREEHEVVVFAYHDSVLRGASRPEFQVRRLVEVQIQNMFAVVPARREMGDQCRWELVVHEKVHAV